MRIKPVGNMLAKLPVVVSAWTMQSNSSRKRETCMHLSVARVHIYVHACMYLFLLSQSLIYPYILRSKYTLKRSKSAFKRCTACRPSDLIWKIGSVTRERKTLDHDERVCTSFKTGLSWWSNRSISSICCWMDCLSSLLYPFSHTSLRLVYNLLSSEICKDAPLVQWTLSTSIFVGSVFRV